MNAQLAQLRDKIRQEAKQVGRQPYSRNLVRMLLRQIDKEFGTAAANQVVRDFKLARKGFNEEPE